MSSPLSTRHVVSVGFYIRSATLKILDFILFSLIHVYMYLAKPILETWLKIKSVFDFRWSFFIGGIPVELQLLLSITLNQSTSIGKHDSNNSRFVNFFFDFFFFTFKLDNKISKYPLEENVSGGKRPNAHFQLAGKFLEQNTPFTVHSWCVRFQDSADDTQERRQNAQCSCSNVGRFDYTLSSAGLTPN